MAFCISTCIVNAAVHILVIVIIHLDRMAYRRQKRWWNAYILFYERQDEKDEKDIYKTLQDLTIGLFSNLQQIRFSQSIRKQGLCINNKTVWIQLFLGLASTVMHFFNMWYSVDDVLFLFNQINSFYMLSEVILLTKFTWFKILYIKTFAVLSVCK